MELKLKNFPALFSSIIQYLNKGYICGTKGQVTHNLPTQSVYCVSYIRVYIDVLQVVKAVNYVVNKIGIDVILIEIIAIKNKNIHTRMFFKFIRIHTFR